MRISDWSSDVCSSDLPVRNLLRRIAPLRQRARHRFGGELVAEAGLITVACDGGHEIAPRAPEGSSSLKPLSRRERGWGEGPVSRWHSRSRRSLLLSLAARRCPRIAGFSSLVLRDNGFSPHPRSEEHTSELQSLMRHSYAVFCLTKKT